MGNLAAKVYVLSKSCIWWIPTFSCSLYWEFRSLCIVYFFHGTLDNLDSGILPFIFFRHSLNPTDHKVSSVYLLSWAIMQTDRSFKIRSLYLYVVIWKPKQNMKKTIYREHEKKSYWNKRDKWMLKLCTMAFLQWKSESKEFGAVFLNPWN